MSNWYIDSVSGSDLNDGTLGYPVSTITRLIQVMAAAGEIDGTGSVFDANTAGNMGDCNLWYALGGAGVLDGDSIYTVGPGIVDDDEVQYSDGNIKKSVVIDNVTGTLESTNPGVIII